MRTEQLVYLLTLSQSESINIASEKLHISHQCLNKSLKSLEAELGTSLFIRTSKGIMLTNTGKKAVETAQSMLAQLKALQAFIADQEGLEHCPALKGALSIAASPLSANTILAPMVKALKSQHPDIVFSINEISPQEVLTALQTDRYDLGITNLADTSSLRCTYPKLCFEPLYEDHTIVLASKYSPLGQYRTLTLSHLLKQPILFYGPAAEEGNYAANLLKQHGSLINCSSTNNMQIYYDSLTSGLYYAVSTESIYRSLDPALRAQLVPIALKEGITAIIVLIYPAKRPHSAKAKVAADFIRS